MPTDITVGWLTNDRWQGKIRAFRLEMLHEAMWRVDNRPPPSLRYPWDATA